MFEQVPGRPELVAGEHAVLDFWEKSGAFDALRRRNAGKPPWSFLDGPITANGFMGVHHAWGRTYKDAFQRYFSMTGHDLRWQNGFDCQGLWVEVQVERDLGFKSKADIEKFGIEEFVNRCKQRVLKYSAIQTRQSIRLGMWMDWDNSYFTMSDENNYTIWSFLKKCHERGYIYKGLDAMPWCPRCGTGISEQERKEGYKQVTDDAVYVSFPLKDREGENLLIWTTTPWTLAANVAAAVNPDLEYVKVRRGSEIFYVAKQRAESVLVAQNGGGNPPSEIIGELKGSALVGWEYKGPFDDFDAAAKARTAHRVIAWDEVDPQSGTGIVHIAPGCGKEDFDLGKSEGLPIIEPIDEHGHYKAGFGPLTGLLASDVAGEVCELLESRGLLIRKERYTHDYPHCWRCSTPLLFRAVDEWYINMDWRDEIKKVVDDITWIPDYGRDLELDWLKNMGDWMISKKRYWGLALPIFECRRCGWFDVIGSREELKERTVSGWEEFEGDADNPNTPHRPWIDNLRIACGACGSETARVPDVGNPWLDAGIVPFSTAGYNRDRAYWAKWIPADFVVESFPGQFRNWFYALLAMSTMMENLAPFKTLLGYALMRDENGDEMHYSKGNAVEFDEAADRIGADVMRWIFCRHTPTSNLNFGYQTAEQTERKIFGTLWNSYLFFTNYALLDGFDPNSETIPAAERDEIDRWILSDLQLLIQEGREQFEKYWLSPFIRRAEEFIDKLSNWYIRRNRQRFWDPVGKDQHGKMAAYQTLYEVLVTLTKTLAPVIPFLTERIYRNLSAGVDGQAAPVSVHLCDYPEVDPSLIDRDLSLKMSLAQNIAGAGRALRESLGIRVRQPLASIIVASKSEQTRSAATQMGRLICDELNVKSISTAENLKELTTVSVKPNYAKLGPRFGKDVAAVASAISALDHAEAEKLRDGAEIIINAGPLGEQQISPDEINVVVETKPGWAVTEAGELQLALETTISDELRKEGMARDVVRHIQQLRKDLGLNIEDQIDCYYESSDTELVEAIEEHREHIAAETQSANLSRGSMGLSSHEVEVEGKPLTLEIIQRSSF